jgi:hypothetical protein
LSTTFKQGQVLGPGDLSISLTDTSGNPTNAFEIHYAIYFVDGQTGAEVLIGPPSRTPVNPAVGEYYAALQIPSSAAIGCYRIRWRFRETSVSAEEGVVMEFGVTGDAALAVSPYSRCEQDLLKKVRIMLGDNCFSGSTRIRLRVSGKLMEATLEEIHQAIGDPGALGEGSQAPSNIEEIRKAFLDGTLEAESVSPEGQVSWKPVLASFKTEGSSLPLYEVSTSQGSMRLTGNHRVFLNPVEKLPAGHLVPGQAVLSIEEREVATLTVKSVRTVPSEQWVYDITVGENHNFQVLQTGIVVSNSPDRNYRFRPPQGEGEIGCYNQVVGYIWLDQELVELFEVALWKWNIFPPNTSELFSSVEALCSKNPSYKAAILWGTLVHAAQMLAYRWTAEEFSVAPETSVRVYLPDGEALDLSIEELYEICKEEEI